MLRTSNATARQGRLWRGRGRVGVGGPCTSYFVFACLCICHDAGRQGRRTCDGMAGAHWRFPCAMPAHALCPRVSRRHGATAAHTLRGVAVLTRGRHELDCHQACRGARHDRMPAWHCGPCRRQLASPPPLCPMQPPCMGGFATFHLSMKLAIHAVPLCMQIAGKLDACLAGATFRGAF